MAQIESPPFQITPNLFDHSQPDTLGLPLADGAETFTIFRPRDDTDKCSHGVVLMPFKDYLYAQWQSSSQDEDGADTWAAYSRTQTGRIGLNRWRSFLSWKAVFIPTAAGGQMARSSRPI